MCVTNCEPQTSCEIVPPKLAAMIVIGGGLHEARAALAAMLNFEKAENVYDVEAALHTGELVPGTRERNALLPAFPNEQEAVHVTKPRAGALYVAGMSISRDGETNPLDEFMEVLSQGLNEHGPETEDRMALQESGNYYRLWTPIQKKPHHRDKVPKTLIMKSYDTYLVKPPSKDKRGKQMFDDQIRSLERIPDKEITRLIVVHNIESDACLNIMRHVVENKKLAQIIEKFVMVWNVYLCDGIPKQLVNSRFNIRNLGYQAIVQFSRDSIFSIIGCNLKKDVSFIPELTREAIGINCEVNSSDAILVLISKKLIDMYSSNPNPASEPDELFAFTYSVRSNERYNHWENIPLQLAGWRDPVSFMPHVSEVFTQQECDAIVQKISSEDRECRICSNPLFGRCSVVTELNCVTPICMVCSGLYSSKLGNNMTRAWVQLENTYNKKLIKVTKVELEKLSEAHSRVLSGANELLLVKCAEQHHYGYLCSSNKPIKNSYAISMINDKVQKTTHALQLNGGYIVIR